MHQRIAEIEQAIAALEANRALLGHRVVDTALLPLREQLAALQPPAASQQLRQLSILFLDVVGSTALSQRLDPEDINAVLDGALARFTAIVQQHHGRVLQYAGDSMLAVFGLRDTHEQAPQFAVQAGLALLAQGRSIGAEVTSRYGLDDFAVRVGIHSGEVLLGGGVDGDNSVRGTSVNIAARMEQTAPVGALRISRDTWRLVRGLFEMDEEPPIQIKGCAEPVVSYLVRAECEGSQARRGVDGLQTPLVGRSQELARLEGALAALLDGRQTQLQRLLLIGDAGLGKSRLLAELRDWLAHQPPAGLLVHVEASESRRHQPYALLLQLFQRQFGLSANTRSTAARHAWLSAIAPQLDSEAAAAVLGQLLGYDFHDHPALGFGEDVRQLRATAFHYASQLLRRAVAPRLWLVDDAHWLDAGSLDFLKHLDTQHADLAMLIVALARPSLLEQQPDWQQTDERHQLLLLGQLDPAASATLADALLAPLGDIPPDLHQLVCAGAEGNPFFMEERVNMLIDQGALLCAPAGWTWQPGRMQGKALPATLRGVLEARLAALPEAERHALQLASVVGMVFWDAALHELDPAAADHLAALQARELIVVRPDSRLSGQREYGFRHHTLYQTCYEGTLKRVRLPAHAKLAGWLAAEGSELHYDLVAEHYERGGVHQQALSYWQQAAESARVRSATSSVRSFVARALALLPPTASVQRFELRRIEARALESRADREALAILIDELAGLADILDDARLRSLAADQRAVFHFHSGDARTSLHWAKLALDHAPDDSPDCKARAYFRQLCARIRLGEREGLAELADAGIQHARQAADRVVEAAILNEMGSDKSDAGEYGGAIHDYQQALALHRSTGHLANEAGTLSNLAYVAFQLGEYPTAYQQFLAALALSDKIGASRHRGIILINIALVLLNQYRASEALDYAHQAMQANRAQNDRWAEAVAWRLAGLAELAAGRLPEAENWLQASRDALTELELGYLALEASAGLVMSALAGGNTAAAHAHAELLVRAIESGLDLGGCDEPAKVWLAAYLGLQAGCDARAPALLYQGRTMLEKQASQIADPAIRRRFLADVPAHAALMAAVNGV